MSNAGTAPIGAGTSSEPSGNHLGTSGAQNPHSPFRGWGSHSRALAVPHSELLRQNRKEGADHCTARRVYRDRVDAGEIKPPRKAKLSAASREAIRICRVERARKNRRDAKQIREAKKQFEREEELRRLAHRGGRPRKVRNG
jgi:hypothetical protein